MPINYADMSSHCFGAPQKNTSFESESMPRKREHLFEVGEHHFFKTFFFFIMILARTLLHFGLANQKRKHGDRSLEQCADLVFDRFSKRLN